MVEPIQPQSRAMQLLKTDERLLERNPVAFDEGEIETQFWRLYPIAEPIYRVIQKDAEPVLQPMGFILPPWPDTQLLEALSTQSLITSFSGVQMRSISTMMAAFSAPDYYKTMQSLRAWTLWESADIRAADGTWEHFWGDEASFDAFRLELHSLCNEDVKPAAKIFMNVPLSKLLDVGCNFLDATEVCRMAIESLEDTIASNHSPEMLQLAGEWARVKEDILLLRSTQENLAQTIIDSHERLMGMPHGNDEDPMEFVEGMIADTLALAQNTRRETSLRHYAAERKTGVVQLSETMQHVLLCMQFIQKKELQFQELGEVWFGGISRMLMPLDGWISEPNNPAKRSACIATFNGFMAQIVHLKARYSDPPANHPALEFQS